MISIVIPYYNRPEKLKRCLDSIFEQTYSNYEIIIVDDCSDLHLELNLNNIKYVKNKINEGPSYCRNLGMKLAQGNYIVFLDCDDYWHKDFLMIVLEKLKSNSKVVMAYSNGYDIEDNCNNTSTRRGKNINITSILPYLLLRGRPWGTGACIWDLNKIKKVNWIDSRNWEDYAFDVAASTVCNRVEFVEDRLVYYDISGDDKLSKQKPSLIVINKNKSINFIASRIRKSTLFEDSQIRNAVKIQILNNCIALRLNNVIDNKYSRKNIQSLKGYMGSFYKVLLFYSSFFGNFFYLRILRKIRNKFIEKINI